MRNWLLGWMVVLFGGLFVFASSTAAVTGWDCFMATVVQEKSPHASALINQYCVIKPAISKKLESAKARKPSK